MDLAKLHLHWRVGKRNGKEYRSYSLARSYRKEGKNRKQIIYKLGKLSEKEIEQWRIVLDTFKNPETFKAELNKISVQSNYVYLDIAVALEIWNFWDLNSVFDSTTQKKKREIPLSSIAAILSINRCINPTSKSRVPIWMEKTILSILLDIPLSEINASRIFRELSCIETCKDQLSRHLCKKMIENHSKSMRSLFYDLSSTTFTGSQCMLVNWGHCKEGYANHVVLALIVNTDGLPIYWEVLEGNTADAKTIFWLLECLKKKLSISIPTMVFDRGMVSDKNLDVLENGNVKYITAMDKNQIKSIAKMDFSKFKQMTIDTVEKQIMKNDNFIKLDPTTYCKEIKVIGNRRYILCFSPQLFKNKKKARSEQITNFILFVEDLNKELLKAKKNRSGEKIKKKLEHYIRKAKLQNFIKIELKEKCIKKSGNKTIRSYQCAFSIDEEKKQETGKLDGFWLLVTNHSEIKNGSFIKDTKAMVKPYRDKVLIESSFRDIKSFIEVSPVYVWKPEHVKAHYTICVLTYLINRTLTLKLHATEGKTSKKIVTHERLYEELAKCHLNYIKIKNINHGIHVFTEQTNIQKDLLERLQMSHLVSDVAIKKLNAKIAVN
jgi:transposase